MLSSQSRLHNAICMKVAASSWYGGFMDLIIRINSSSRSGGKVSKIFSNWEVLQPSVTSLNISFTTKRTHKKTPLALRRISSEILDISSGFLTSICWKNLFERKVPFKNVSKSPYVRSSSRSWGKASNATLYATQGLLETHSLTFVRWEKETRRSTRLEGSSLAPSNSSKPSIRSRNLMGLVEVLVAYSGYCRTKLRHSFSSGKVHRACCTVVWMARWSLAHKPPLRACFKASFRRRLLATSRSISGRLTQSWYINDRRSPSRERCDFVPLYQK